MDNESFEKYGKAVDYVKSRISAKREFNNYIAFDIQAIRKEFAEEYGVERY